MHDPSKPPAIQVTTTCDRRESLEAIGQALVERRLAACVQIGPPIRSIYRWRGQIESADEWMCLIKTTPARFQEVLACIRELHPYETPEVIAVPIVGGSDDYLAWLTEESAPEAGS